MKHTRILRIAAALLASSQLLLLSGCWDNHELDSLFIVTGVALDEAADPEQMDISLQIGKIKSTESDSAGGNPQEDATIELRTTGYTMMEGLLEFDRDSSRTLLLQHNQVLLLGSSLAEQGILGRLDLFLRDLEARMEVLVMVADGRADDLLNANPDQDRISAMYLSRMMQDLYNMSPHYKIRLLDFVSRLRDGTSSPIAPIVSLFENDNQESFKITGYAVFKEGSMIGRLNMDQVMGYIWATGPAQRCGIVAQSERGRVVFQVASLKTERDVTLTPEGGVKAELSVEATLSIAELRGFEDMTSKELMPYLLEVAQDQLEEQIATTFEIAQRLNADIYGFGASVHRKYPKQWREMEGRWDELFPEMELEIKIKPHIPATGQIVTSLEMGEGDS